MIARILFGDEPIFILPSELQPKLVEVQCALRKFGLETIAYNSAHQSLHRGEEEFPLDSLNGTPTCPCVVIGQPEEVTALTTMLSAWSIDPVICQVDLSAESWARDGWAELGNALATALKHHYRYLSRQAVEHLQEISSLRAEVERQRTLLAEFGALIGGRRLRLDTVIKANAIVERPGGLPEERMAFQLPCSVTALERFDLQFETSGGEGTIRVVLQTGEHPRVVGDWQLAYSEINNNEWQTFALQTALSDVGQGLKLSVHWTTTKGPPPGLRMSDVVALPRGESFIDLPIETVSLPALRIWRGVPNRISSEFATRMRPEAEWSIPPSDDR